MQINILSRFQWTMLLLIYMATPTLWAAPNALFTTDVDSEGTPFFVFLNAICSSPWPGDKAITDLQWTDSESGNILQHITTSTSFSTTGTYSITLTVWDAAGNKDSLTKTVTIPQVSTPPPTPCFTVAEIDDYTVNLNASISFPRGNITQYEYSWEGGKQTAPTSQTAIQFDEHPGTYNISLHVTDKQGRRSSKPAIRTVTVPQYIPPSSSFKVGIDGLTVRLDATASKPANNATRITKYEYSWGTGSHTATTLPTSITFNKGGQYTISLHVTDDKGNKSKTSAVHSVTIVPPLNPQSKFEVSSTNGLTANLDASASIPGSDANSITQYDYSWGTGKSHTAITFQTSITFDKSGQYIVSLHVIDGKGNKSETPAEQTIIIETEKPMAHFTATTSQWSQATVLLDASNSGAVNGRTITTYLWETDDKGQLDSQNGPIVFVSFSQDGTHKIKLTVTDDSGQTGSAEKDVHIPSIAADFEIKSRGNKVLSTFEIDIANSLNLNGEIQSYEWFLGTGLDCEKRVADQDALEVAFHDNSIHKIRFTKPGTHNLCFKVTDALSFSGYKGETITINGYGGDAFSSTGNKGGEFVKGGILIEDKFLPNNSQLSSETFVDIVAEITATPDGTVDMYVVAEYKPIEVETSQWFMKDWEKANFRNLNNGDFSLLQPAYKAVSFENGKNYTLIFSGKLSLFPGQYNLYVGYDTDSPLDMGRAVYNITPISFSVVPSSIIPNSTTPDSTTDTSTPSTSTPSTSTPSTSTPSLFPLVPR